MQPTQEQQTQEQPPPEQQTQEQSATMQQPPVKPARPSLPMCLEGQVPMLHQRTSAGRPE